MLFVVDTNIFVSALSTTSPYYWVIEALLDERFEICFNYEILLEYEEILTRKYASNIAANFIKALQELPSAHHVDVYFNWNLLEDKDDNKFVDVAVAGGASFIITEDRHFRKLSEIDFPKIEVMRLEDFKKWLDNIAAANTEV